MSAPAQPLPVGGRPALALAGAAGAGAAAAAPPAVLPGEHFGFGLACLWAGAAGLAWAAPDLAAGAYPSPRVVGVTHLWTLGWITTSILGALYQFLPVALGVPIRSERAAHVSFALLAAGVLAFVGGLAIGARPAAHAGASAVALALAIAAVNLLATLRSSRERGVTWWALGGAAVALIATLSLGLTMAIAGGGALGVSPLTLLGVHVHLALGGFVLLVVVAVGNHLLPMFLLSHGAPAWPARLAAASLAAGCASLALPWLGAGWWPTAALLTVGLGAFLLQARLFHRHRVRRRLDGGMRLALGALPGLLLAVIAGWAVLITDAPDPRLLTAYGLLAVMSLGLFVAGHYYKIVPFLIWFHRFGPRLGREPVPRVADLTDPTLARAAGALLLAGLVTAAAGVLLGSVWAVRIAGIALTIGVTVEIAQLLVALGRRTA